MVTHMLAPVWGHHLGRKIRRVEYTAVKLVVGPITLISGEVSGCSLHAQCHCHCPIVSLSHHDSNSSNCWPRTADLLAWS